MKKLRHFLFLSSSLLLASSLSAKENIGRPGIKPAPSNPARNITVADCSPAAAKTDLAVNNVRAKIFTGGDMWWNLVDNAAYEIPKGSKKHSLFAGSLWIGGFDASNNLKVAAMTYRQDGNDFWPGPLDTTNANTDKSTCADYDKHFAITLAEVEQFYGYKNDPSSFEGYTIPQSILNWPGNSKSSIHSRFLAPFVDSDGDGIYDPLNSADYPAYDLVNSGCDDRERIYGDETLWWVFNDKGNIHTETGGNPIGLEIHAQAFGFRKNDEINDMTFYKYKVINRSSARMDSTYFAMWVDPDLGFYNDDFIGCDVQRGLGFCYNANENDGTGGVGTYGANPPAVGVDFFQGPLADPDGIDNSSSGTANGTGYSDGIVDNERLGMEKFMFYKNDFSLEGNPENAQHIYNYLGGRWKDGTPITYGGTGHLSGGPVGDFMFPWDTDTKNPTPWEMQGTPADGRFLHSAGIFSLQPGAVNFITIGCVWARATTGGPKESVRLLKAADDKAQRLFDNCFQVINGPNAPDLEIKEMDQQLIVYLKNKPLVSNNFQESYEETDINISPLFADNKYRFEGYKLYQVANASVSPNDLFNPNLARLVAVTDKKNGVGRIVNYEFDVSYNGTVPMEMVVGPDKGIQHSFIINEDLFAQGDKKLVNHKTYYFLAVAYGYNQYKPYKQDTPPDQFNPYDPNIADYTGQKAPYLQGRKNVLVKSAIPHIRAIQENGTILHSTYGQGVKITRTEGQGNGAVVLELTKESITNILNSSSGKYPTLVYETGAGPVQVKVIDPLSVTNSNFTLEVKDTLITSPLAPPVAPASELTDAFWVLTNTTTGRKYSSNHSLKVLSEEIITEEGISISMEQPVDVGFTGAPKLGFIQATQTFAEEDKQWLGFLPDVDAFEPLNWIRSGQQNDVDYATTSGFIDPNQDFEQILEGGWAPYRLVSNAKHHPAGAGTLLTLNSLNNTASVDIVITADKSKWTRCPVLEMQDTVPQAEGGAKKLDIRKAPSRDINNNIIPSDSGMSYFPGYAINLETGERLNMAFGEDSWLSGENGRDMWWNPTSDITTSGDFNDPSILFGGKHYIYVFGHNADLYYDSTATLPSIIRKQRKSIPAYDNGETMRRLLKATEYSTSQAYKREVFKDVMWVAMPVLAPGRNLLETDLTVKLRVGKPFKKYGTGTPITWEWSPVPGVAKMTSKLVPGQTYYVEAGPIKHGPVKTAAEWNNAALTLTYQAGTSFVALSDTFTTITSSTTGAPTSAGQIIVRVTTTTNSGNPKYSFTTDGLAAEKASDDAFKNALDLINVVPNPYYAYSEYESNPVQNLVKITNLPQKCTVSIYTVNGTLVRRYKKDEEKTSLDWDLKNTANIPIASGLYIIHVDADGKGERILKWFGVMRKADLETF